VKTPSDYRGRLAPSPTGFLHLGHARTFWVAYSRALAGEGILVLRNEDLDRDRCRADFTTALIEDLKWLGLAWQEGPDCGGPFGPYEQSRRLAQYEDAFQKLRAGGFVYPCACSRRDVLHALQAPHHGEDEPIYPGTCRRFAHAASGQTFGPLEFNNLKSSKPVNWRFRVTDGEVVSFLDGHYGRQEFVAGRDFGDFIVWRHDNNPSYQLAVVVDDAAMRVTEVVRGADLLPSTARQLLVYRALGLCVPSFYHCPLMTDSSGVRLAKRHDALSLRKLRADGAVSEALRAAWGLRSGKIPGEFS
jgi:glutamyl/glutaminyl-tRNA synthetase